MHSEGCFCYNETEDLLNTVGIMRKENYEGILEDSAFPPAAHLIILYQIIR